ncbi:hypothetical protein UPYG_G00346560 [Umbra pygmaea]|uniref:Poly [ADP-ribose] polymerase 12-like n=1 Tax=Umbra pygmaea TaxID=75934 RepID=A0ABD0VXP2_UMBPY
MESAVTKLICANNGSMNVEEISANFHSDLISNSDKFCVVFFNGEQRVVAKTSVRLCRSLNCQGCRNLHFCKRFLLGECPFVKRRGGCRFSHELTSENNRSILIEHGLENLDRTELCTLLLQNDSFLLPPVCHDYNNGFGEYGKCEDGEACKRLHVCETFMRGYCNCTRCHDFFEPHPLKTLQDKGVPNILIGSLKSVYMNIQLLQRRDHANQGKQRQNTRADASANTNKRNQSNRVPEMSQDRLTRCHQTNDEDLVAGAAALNKRKASNTPGPDKTDICMYFIKGSCKHGDRCFKVHSTLPYQWEERQGKHWQPLKDNEDIEKDYCNPAKTYSRGFQPVCFDTMTCGLNKARRLSTISSVLQPTFVLTTEWAWFWEDEFGNWIQYASASGGHKAATITSEDLERRYQEDNKAVVEFIAGAQTYELSFSDMIQTNKRYGTKKVVRRRPVFVASADVPTLKNSKRAPCSRLNFRALPECWDKKQIPETGYKKVNLPCLLKEYKDIQQLFLKTMRGFTIHQIERIQNKALWEGFQWQKDNMTKNNRGRNVMEKQLFHGTDSKHLNAICLNNFDWRICGLNGTAYGRGSYFARDAKYSHSYTGQSNMRSMFVCRVLAGDYTKGDPSYLRPPSKDGGDTIFYDSCVDSVSNPSIFVIFEKHQVYPEYLIQYSEEDHWSQYSQPFAPASMPARVPAPVPRPAPVHRPAPPQYQAPPPKSDNSCVIS